VDKLDYILKGLTPGRGLYFLECLKKDLGTARVILREDLFLSLDLAEKTVREIKDQMMG
jgi:hypothetical protein